VYNYKQSEKEQVNQTVQEVNKNCTTEIPNRKCFKCNQVQIINYKWICRRNFCYKKLYLKNF